MASVNADDAPVTPADAQLAQPSGETALIVIDMQNSYFELPGLSDKKDVVGPVNELIAAAHEAGRPVVLVRTEHQPDGSTWTLNMREDRQGFAFPGSEQAQFLADLDTRDHVEIVKTRDSAFHETRLSEELQRLGVAHVLLCGISTHSCVAQTATAAFAQNLHAAVAIDAVTSENEALSEALLAFLHEEMRQPLLDQAASVALLRDGWS